MEKRNTLLLTVIAIATLLVAVVGATFAYVASNIGNETIKEPEFNDDGTATFFATGTSLALGVTSEQMQSMELGQNYASNQGSLTVTYNAAGSRETSCTYDVYFRWTSPDKYINHSKYYNGIDYVDNTGKEFTVIVSTMVDFSTGKGISGTSFIDPIALDENHEIDFSELDGCDSLTGCKIGSGVVYSNTNEHNKTTSVTWNFKNTIYNLENIQDDETYGIADKHFIGDYYITNVKC